MIQELWENDSLPKDCFLNGFGLENIKLMARIKQPSNPLEAQAMNLIKLIEHTATVEEQRRDIAQYLPAIEAVIAGEVKDVDFKPLTTKEFSESLLKLASAASQLESLRSQPLDHILGVIRNGELIPSDAIANNGTKATTKAESVSKA